MYVAIDPSPAGLCCAANFWLCRFFFPGWDLCVRHGYWPSEQWYLGCSGTVQEARDRIPPGRVSDPTANHVLSVLWFGLKEFHVIKQACRLWPASGRLLMWFINSEQSKHRLFQSNSEHLSSADDSGRPRRLGTNVLMPHQSQWKLRDLD